jgi:phosphodiesterase/alkaline phosphatase D-like protein
MTFRTSAAASPPSVTEPVVASSLGLYTATVRANNVNAGASAATVAFEYGTTIAYGSEAAYGSPIPVVASASPQVNLSGLLPATTYHVRCRARNAQGTSYSPDATFTTPAVPVLTANNATNVTDMTATMNGQALYPGLTLSSLRFTYGTGGIYSNSQYSITSTPGAVPGSYLLSFNLTGLIPNTTYNYRLEAGSPWGENYVSAGKTFTTGPPNTPPTMSGLLTVSAVSNTKARISPPLMRAGSSNTTVVYEYGLTTSYGSTKAGPAIAFNQSSTESVDLINLLPATTYHVRCKATNAQGVAVSANVAFTTSGTPLVTTLTPTSVTDLTAIFKGTVNPKGGTISVGYEWGESSSMLTPLSYTVTGSVFQNVTGTSALPFSSPLLSNLKPGTTYYYRIYAWDALNTWNGALLSFTTPAASTPPSLNGSLAVSSVTMRTAVATFKNVLGNGAIFAGGKDAAVSIEYGTTTTYGSSVTLLNVGSSVSTGASLTSAIGTMKNLQGGTLYHVRLKVSSLLATVYSGDVTFTTLTDPIVVTGGVTTPGEFTATLSADVTAGPGTQAASVYFDWGLTESYGSSSAGTYGYSVITVPGGTTSQVALPISGLSPGKVFHYRAKAFGYTDPSNGATVWYYGADRTFSTLAAATPPRITSVPAVSNIKSTSAFVQTSYFTGSSTTAVTLEYGLTTSYGSQSPLATNSTPNATTSGGATLTGLLPSTTYHVRAKVVNAQGTAYGEDATFTTVTPPTLSLAPASGITSSTATLNGTRVSGDSTVFSFRFEWGLTTAYGSTGNAARDVNSLSATISGLIPSTTYHYRLVATDGITTTVTDDASLVSGPSPVPPVLGAASSAYSITPTAATLWINSVSAPATVVFDYGLTTSYGSVAVYPLTTSPDGTLRNVTVELANLLPGTTYHYRCRATNTLGATLGKDGIFRTLGLPDLLTQIPGALADKSLVLQGEINAQDGLLAPSFELGTTTAYGQVVAIQQGMVSGASLEPVSAPLAGLLPETTYHFRLKARDPRGGQYFGQSMAVKTLSVAQAWRFKYFQTTENTGDAADGANPSGDGISNLIKYALDMDPHQPAALPVMAGIRTQGNGRRLGFSFVRDAEKREITYLVEAAYSPAGPWQALAASIGGQPAAGPGLVGEFDAGGSKRTVEIQDTIDMSQAPARFIRLQVTREGEVRTLSEAQAWRLRYFGVIEPTGTAADDANPSGDGVSNLMKYALNLDPLKSSGLPAMTSIRPLAPGRKLGFSFVRDPEKRDITYLVEAAASPAGPWQPLATSTGGSPATGIGVVDESDATGGKRQVDVQDIVEMSAAPARFMRLGVTRDRQ